SPPSPSCRCKTEVLPANDPIPSDRARYLQKASQPASTLRKAAQYAAKKRLARGLRSGRCCDGLARELEEGRELFDEVRADRVEVGERVEVAEQAEVHLPVV